MLLFINLRNSTSCRLLCSRSTSSLNNATLTSKSALSLTKRLSKSSLSLTKRFLWRSINSSNEFCSRSLVFWVWLSRIAASCCCLSCSCCCCWYKRACKAVWSMKGDEIGAAEESNWDGDVRVGSWCCKRACKAGWPMKGDYRGVGRVKVALLRLEVDREQSRRHEVELRKLMNWPSLFFFLRRGDA